MKLFHLLSLISHRLNIKICLLLNETRLSSNRNAFRQFFSKNPPSEHCEWQTLTNIANNVKVNIVNTGNIEEHEIKPIQCNPTRLIWYGPFSKNSTIWELRCQLSHGGDVGFDFRGSYVSRALHFRINLIKSEKHSLVKILWIWIYPKYLEF